MSERKKTLHVRDKFQGDLIKIWNLPYDAEVEYLESTGMQWIDTGVVFGEASHTYRWEIIAQAINSGSRSYNWFCGFFENGVHSVGTYPDTNSQYVFYSVGTYYQNGIAVSNPITNGDKYGIVSNIAEFSGASYSLAVTAFTRMMATGPAASAANRVFEFRIWDGANLMRNFQPVRFTNEYGETEGAMYDKVSKQLFRNQGTGSFQYGNDI